MSVSLPSIKNAVSHSIAASSNSLAMTRPATSKSAPLPSIRNLGDSAAEIGEVAKNLLDNFSKLIFSISRQARAIKKLASSHCLWEMETPSSIEKKERQAAILKANFNQLNNELIKKIQQYEDSVNFMTSPVLKFVRELSIRDMKILRLENKKQGMEHLHAIKVSISRIKEKLDSGSCIDLAN